MLNKGLLILAVMLLSSQKVSAADQQDFSSILVTAQPTSFAPTARPTTAPSVTQADEQAHEQECPNGVLFGDINGIPVSAGLNQCVVDPEDKKKSIMATCLDLHTLDNRYNVGAYQLIIKGYENNHCQRNDLVPETHATLLQAARKFEEKGYEICSANHFETYDECMEFVPDSVKTTEPLTTFTKRQTPAPTKVCPKGELFGEVNGKSVSADFNECIVDPEDPNKSIMATCLDIHTFFNSAKVGTYQIIIKGYENNHCQRNEHVPENFETVAKGYDEFIRKGYDICGDVYNRFETYDECMEAVPGRKASKVVSHKRRLLN